MPPILDTLATSAVLVVVSPLGSNEDITAEYVSLGIPVAASTLRTVRHYFPEDAIGYFQPGSPDSLAETLLELYTHPERRRGLSERAREVAKRISWEVQREILYDAVDLLLQVKGASIRHSPRG